MGSKNLVIDTGILIEFLRAQDKSNTTFYQLIEKSKLCISSVTLYELLMGATDDLKKEEVNKIISNLIILPFDADASKVASEIYHKLRKSNKMIEFRDIFIATTCIIHKLPLKTLNKKHFERITSLKLA
jgi:tRNA(fMet)-specific endonuclease VapC